MALAGKQLAVKVSTDGTAYNLVGDLNEAKMEIDGDNQDVTSFGSEFIKRLQGLKDTKFDLKGFYNSTDTDGQVAIRSALINDTPLYVQILPDGSTGFQQEVKVSKYETDAKVDGLVEVSIECEGTDAVTLV